MVKSVIFGFSAGVIVLFVCITIFIEYHITQSADNFEKIERITRNTLETQIERVKFCSSILSENLCKLKQKDLYPPINDIKYRIKMYFGPQTVLIEPRVSNESQIVIGIPVGASELEARIAIRQTYTEIKQIGSYSITYIFVTGLSTNENYKNDYLKEESNKYGDLLIFNFHNSYNNIFHLMMSCYNYIYTNFRNLKYFLRVNSDVLFYPQKLLPFINSEYDVIAEIKQLYEKKKNKMVHVVYPEGCFNIFSNHFIKFIDSTGVPQIASKCDDVYNGNLIRRYLAYNKSFLKIWDIGHEYMEAWSGITTDMNMKRYIALHPVTPAMIVYLYNRNK